MIATEPNGYETVDQTFSVLVYTIMNAGIVMRARRIADVRVNARAVLVHVMPATSKQRMYVECN
tara:strand:- start:485 stop:676 length:192 start_codon:yes stop_codon:yes gene_type:complete